MRKSATQINLNDRTLWSVPAVHFRFPFAEQVNDLCATATTRPDAVAVELGPATAAAAWQWLRELGVRPSHRFRLPCMLGLAHTNRRLHPSVKEKALHLQKTTGRDLHELRPDLLKELLGYSTVSVLYLSPTDSIIEAIRCALELDVPLYGVDLEESAARQPHPGILEDPLAASGYVDRYVERNMGFADTHRDEAIDERREQAMAARLKTVLNKHRRVLFTGGLAHWKRLQVLLHAESLRPAPVVDASALTPEGFQRVVVSPLLAVHHMDLFPAFTERFESRRLPADQPLGHKDHINAAALFDDLLKESYETHFSAVGNEQLNRTQEDWEAYEHFQQFLGNLCLVRQIRIADLFTALAAAQSTMSPQFASVLANVLMRFTWAKPDQFQDLPILAASPTEDGKPLRAEFVDSGTGRRGRYFYIDPLPGQGTYSVSVPIPWEWDQEQPPPPPPPGPSYLQAWLPRCYLRTALSLRAIELARTQGQTPRTEEFQGNLLGGLDLKATLRAHSRGDERIYVIDTPPKKSTSRADKQLEWQPVVWIARTAVEPNSRWIVFSDEAREDILPLIRDRAAFETIVNDPDRGGTHLVHQIAYGTHSNDEALSCGQYRIKRIDFCGVLLYHPVFFSPLQTARMAEESEYERHPMTHGAVSYWGSPQPLVDMFRKRHGVEVREQDWQNSLVRMAIPYASDSVTVVSPDGFELDGAVYRDAARSGVVIRRVPLSYFDRQLVLKSMSEILTPIVDRDQYDEPIYPEFLERRLREKPTTFRNLIPAQILRYGMPVDPKSRA